MRPRTSPDDGSAEAEQVAHDLAREQIEPIVRAIFEQIEAERLADATELIAEVGEFDIEPTIRRVAREEIASLCGLVLRRTEGRGGMAMRVELASIFGEALADFSGRTGDGDEPGD